MSKQNSKTATAKSEQSDPNAATPKKKLHPLHVALLSARQRLTDLHGLSASSRGHAQGLFFHIDTSQVVAEIDAALEKHTGELL